MLSEKVIADDRRSVSLREESYSSDLDNLDRIEDLTFKPWRNLCDEFLAGFEVPESDEFSLWLSKERTRMKETVISRLKQRLAKAYEESNLEECRRTLKTVLELDSYDEDSCLELMELYFEGGELPKALSLFSSFQAKIAEDLNIKPSSRAEDFVVNYPYL